MNWDSPHMETTTKEECNGSQENEEEHNGGTLILNIFTTQY